MKTTTPRVALGRADNAPAETPGARCVARKLSPPRAAAALGSEPAGELSRQDLGALSDRELVLALERVCTSERETRLKILVYLVEIERRRVYLPLGYGSLFEFCRRRLGYSESASARRIAVARCIRDFPRVYELLLGGRVTFSTIERLSRVMTATNADELLSEAEGRSEREIDSLVARERPQGMIRERVRPVWVRTELVVESGCENGAGREDGPDTAPCGTAGAGGDSPCAEVPEGARTPVMPEDLRKVTPARDGKKSATSGPAARRAVVLEQRFKLEFGVEPQCLEKLEQVRVLLSGRCHGKLELGRLFEIMLDDGEKTQRDIWLSTPCCYRWNKGNSDRFREDISRKIDTVPRGNTTLAPL